MFSVYCAAAGCFGLNHGFRVKQRLFQDGTVVEIERHFHAIRLFIGEIFWKSRGFWRYREGFIPRGMVVATDSGGLWRETVFVPPLENRAQEEPGY